MKAFLRKDHALGRPYFTVQFRDGRYPATRFLDGTRTARPEQAYTWLFGPRRPKPLDVLEAARFSHSVAPFKIVPLG